jgi:hypothetical protein
LGNYKSLGFNKKWPDSKLTVVSYLGKIINN